MSNFENSRGDYPYFLQKADKTTSAVLLYLTYLYAKLTQLHLKNHRLCLAGEDELGAE